MSGFGQTRIVSIAAGLALSFLLCAEAMAGGAEATAKKFFDAYRARDVDAMGQLFTKDATFVYVPFGEAGRGNVLEKGIPVWRTLIETFPNLRNEVNAVWEDKTGRVAFVDVHIGGTQAKDGFGIANQGKDYWLRHLFVLETDEMGHITKITSFWDNATWFSQLGKTSLK
jgi:ketosteroid isomerase-like protein